MYTENNANENLIRVYFEALHGTVAVLRIEPGMKRNKLTKIVSDTIKECPGSRGYFLDKICGYEAWHFDALMLSGLTAAFSKLYASDEILVSLCGYDNFSEQIDEIEKKRKLTTPTLADYAENEEFYNSMGNAYPYEASENSGKENTITSETSLDNPSLEAEVEKIIKSATETTAEDSAEEFSETDNDAFADSAANKDEKNFRLSAIAMEADPVLSDENCVYRYMCFKGCPGTCEKYRSVSDAFINKWTVKKDQNADEISLYTPDTQWTGKSKAASGTGHFLNGSESLFTIEAGSQMAKKRAVSLEDSIAEKRKDLKRSKIVDEEGVFLVDCPFKNVGEATSVLTGSTSHWKTFWKYKKEEKILECNSPTFACAFFNGHKIIGMPVLVKQEWIKSCTLKFVLLEGNIIKFGNKSNLSQQQKKLQIEFKKNLSKEGRLKADYVFDSADLAAKIITGDRIFDASFWTVTKNITMKDVQNVHCFDTYNGETVYHLDIATIGTVAALYVQKDEKEKFIVIKGSMVTPLLFASCPGNCQRMYKEMRKNGSIFNGVLTRDIIFTSASAAAAVSAARTMNGPQEWKTVDGRPLKAEKRSVKKPRI